MAAEIAKLQPTLLILSTPHGISLEKDIGVYLNGDAKGNGEWNDEWKEYEIEVSISDCGLFTVVV